MAGGEIRTPQVHQIKATSSLGSQGQRRRVCPGIIR
jgi:hypothetical protein